MVFETVAKDCLTVVEIGQIASTVGSKCSARPQISFISSNNRVSPIGNQRGSDPNDIVVSISTISADSALLMSSAIFSTCR